MTKEKQAEIISEACKRHGLDGHIRWIKRKADASTWAERIAIRFKKRTSLPVKNSYVYCDTLDMCFFFSDNGNTPSVAYAGYTTVGRTDLEEGKLLKAFQKANEILKTMELLAEEVRQNDG